MASRQHSLMPASDAYEPLAQALDDLIAVASGEGELDEDQNASLMSALVEAVPSLEPDEVRVLHEKLECAMAAIHARQVLVAEKLGEIKHSRRALSSYDHIKTFDKEQRLYRRA